MSVSELSLSELAAERGELLPEREALQLLVGNFSSITQSAANVAILSHNVHQSISQTATANQAFVVL